MKIEKKIYLKIGQIFTIESSLNCEQPIESSQGLKTFSTDYKNIL